MVCDPGPAGVSESAFAGGADAWAAAVVLVGGGDVADPGVQPGRVVLVADDGELGPQDGGVADAVEVRPVGLDVAEQALDPGLIGRRSGPAEVLGDRAHRHELAGRAARHLRPVVRDGEQHRRENVNVNVGREGEGVGGHGVLACLDELEQSLGLERVEEHDLHLGRGFFDRDELGDPFAGHEVHHGEHRDLRAAGEMRAVVDPDRVAAVVRPFRERPTLGADPAGPLQMKAVCSQNAPDGGWGDPHLADVAAAVRELAMRAIDIAPALEQLEDRGDLLGAQAVDRAARLAVPETVGIAPAAPPPRPALVQLEIGAGAAVLPAAGDGPVDQAEQLMLGGRVDATRDPATQPQRSFPSASIKRTPISFSASDSRAISARAA
jgi:hypothetical protein